VHYNRVELALAKLALEYHAVSMVSMLPRRKERSAKREEKIWKRGKGEDCVRLFISM
jgi:hypothetical protein